MREDLRLRKMPWKEQRDENTSHPRHLPVFAQKSHQTENIVNSPSKLLRVHPTITYKKPRWLPALPPSTPQLPHRVAVRTDHKHVTKSYFLAILSNCCFVGTLISQLLAPLSSTPSVWMHRSGFMPPRRALAVVLSAAPVLRSLMSCPIAVLCSAVSTLGATPH